MGKKFLFFLTCCLMTASMAFAQKQASGTVFDSDTGEPMVGVTVKVKGTNIGVMTDINGKFTLRNIPDKVQTLDFSIVGMQPMTVKIHNNMKVYMSASISDLDEVMVVAYGTQKKSSFTGSAAIVDAQEISKVQVTNAVDALKGKAAGVQITSMSGQPDQESTVRIRGFNSLVAGQNPLIVLDGSPYDGTLNSISPSDIESMTVLKDAASTALYGARGGNGVILITTKSGKSHKDAEISVDMKWGANMKGTRRYDVIDNPAGYYEVYYQGLHNYAVNQLGKNATGAWQWANANLIDNTGGFGLAYNVYNVPAGQAMIGTNGKLNPSATLGNIVTGRDGNQYYLTPDSWNDETYHNGLRQDYSVSASGSSDKGNYYASVNYLGNEGITTNSEYKRLTTRLKADYNLKSWFKIGANVSYSHADSKYVDRSTSNGEGSSTVGNVFALQYLAPIYPVYMRDANGVILTHKESGIPAYDYGDATSGLGIARPYMGQSNPLSDMLVDTRKQTSNRFNGVGTAQLILPYGFTVTSINSVYLSENRYNDATNPYFGQYKNQNGSVVVEQARTLNQNFQQRINWHQQYDKHDIEVMVGHEYYKTNEVDLWGQRHNMFYQGNIELGGAVIVDNTSSSEATYNTESWLARAMYSYDDRYYVHLSGMRQGSSAFHPNNRWGSFYSASAGWMISKEDWFKADWVNELKLKASFGQNGNDFGLNGYYYTNRYSIVNSNGSVSLVPSTLGKNEKFSWETNTKFNIGADFAFFKNRLSGSVEYYNNHTSGLVSSIPYAPSFGYTSFYDNVGNMRNHGVEIDLHGVVIRTKDFEWNIYANITSNSNEITELADERKTQYMDGRMGYSSDSYFFSEGMSRYSFFTKKYAGIYDKSTYKSTYAPGTAEDQMVYEPSKEGMALYYKDVYAMKPATNPDGSIQTDKDGNVVYTDEIAKNPDGSQTVTGTYTTTNGGEATDYIYGDMLPDVYGGFGTSFAYKGFDLSVDFQYQLGGHVYDSGYASLMGMDAGYAFHTDLQKAWSPTNTGSDIPRLNVGDSYMAYGSDRFITSARYLTLGNVTFGYTLPKEVLRKIKLQKLRLYIVGDNLFTWSARKGLDPRQSMTGSSSTLYYSSIRAVSGGVQVTF